MGTRQGAGELSFANPLGAVSLEILRGGHSDSDVVARLSAELCFQDQAVATSMDLHMRENILNFSVPGAVIVLLLSKKIEAGKLEHGVYYST